MDEVTLYEEPPEVVTGEVMEFILVEKDLDGFRNAWLVTLHGHHYIVSAEVAVFEAYQDRKGEWQMGDEVFDTRQASSMLDLIWRWERGKEDQVHYTYGAFDDLIGKHVYFKFPGWGNMKPGNIYFD